MDPDSIRHFMIEIKVLFFGRVKELLGRASDSLTIADSATVQAVLDRYSSRNPEMKALLPSLAVAVNQQYVSSDTAVKDGDEVALLPPVSGGSEAAKSSRAALVREKIDSACIVQEIRQPADGAVAVFEGIVRDHTRERRTLYLDYEAYEDMALKQMEELAASALRDFKVREVRIVHRLGRLEISETSVLIAVASEHRAAAFDACRWLIDTFKRTVPIWKKEHFKGGAVWASGEPFPVDIHSPRGTP